MYLLEEKIYFWLLCLIPVLVVLFIGLSYWRYRAQKKYANKEMLDHLIPNRSWFKPILKLVTVCVGIIFLVLALVNLKAGEKIETVNREGVDIVFAVDVSKSMLAEDIAPNRLEKSQRLVTEIINNLASDRIGLIAYAGSAVPQLPITTDYGSARLFLQSLNTDLVSSQGTAINEAIQLAESYYSEDTEAAKILVIISDGEDHEGESVAVAEAAAEKGIRIITIGVGTEKGATIPIKRDGIIREFKKDRDGKTVMTKLNPETLKEIAEAGNGAYIDGTVTATVIEQLKEELAGIDKVAFDSQQYADFESQFQWFLGFGLFFLFLDLFYLERKTGWLQKLNLFNE
ncbi:Ca-activated chloride channel family protein [Nonlabens dokdonensis]|jgi:Ca-activated chloride channel family protein|uniref:BatB n=2 Tax=Nonlabens dokdonensis TaxID=328515 RepID=L7W8X9_NONDD|nr:VWA domain-containing protein [Nonlabens dokdonensis]AGC76271.1 BatB [Nonlabens dokdonensis DSW-6]PZX43933.1 Ca-activated chloride channel family protein [Nonlabens dokdonensis]